METTERVREEEEEVEVEESKVGAGVGVKWERFLPRMVLRVLLVEADDSTRQIIAALLRKCSYRVAAVPDGLKAWELLKGRPHDVDLILTEVDLPSISGFALLTLIMEHDICKNIPVIMMSSHDAVSTVYNCMLRGAADYLVKPIRKNELKNLWQHVWRRQSSSSSGNGNGQQDETVALRKVEATAENNAASNNSGGFLVCAERDKELVEKGSDAQSSCTKPELGVDPAEVEQKPDLSQPGREKDVKSEGHGRDGIRFNANGVPGHHDTAIGSVKEAINFIETFDNQPVADCRFSYYMKGSDLSSQLDLSLRRSDSGCGQKPGEGGALNHSDASAFSRYVNKSLHPTLSGSVKSVASLQQNEGGGNLHTVHRAVSPVESDVLDLAQPTSNTTPAAPPRQLERFHSSSQQNVFPAPTPVKRIRIDNQCTEYGSAFPKVCFGQSGASPMPSPSTVGRPESFSGVESIKSFSHENNHVDRIRDPADYNGSNSSIRSSHKQEVILEHLEDRALISCGTDRSASSSFCNGTLTQLNSNECVSICGSNGNVNQVLARGHTGENADGFAPQEGIPQISSQREAALAKFRMKRKDRCYEKKVRYESRKKLAEQRPRVKGQFVKQVPTGPAPRDTDQ
ncbi:hypothetical protein MLD38_002971 [Melastoma candidum]|uniref:Uncharacterized protein n=1 Tax=Melastoma candidum TaxID=119954 RepID=A0ACB9S9M4_9MYRT|nr:hypothetical protein MLD38_002971 [Melastoma candidum]